MNKRDYLKRLLRKDIGLSIISNKLSADKKKYTKQLAKLRRKTDFYSDSIPDNDLVADYMPKDALVSTFVDAWHHPKKRGAKQ